MATLTPTLKLESTDATTDTLSLTKTDSVNVGTPIIGPARKVAAASGGTKIDIDATGGGNKYVYILHTGKQNDGATSTTNTLTVCLKTGGTVYDIGVLKAEEFMYIPVLSANLIQVVSSSTHTIQVEYAYWTAA